MTCQVLERHTLPFLAYDVLSGEDPSLPVLLYLSGYGSDRTGSKAMALQAWASVHGWPLVRFDYSGSGQSGGCFQDFGIGDWLADAVDVVDQVVPPGRPLLVVGSSMGGWIGLRLALARPERVSGFVGIAASLDFTERMYLSVLTDDQRVALHETGAVEIAGAADRPPYYVSKRMIEQGQDMLLLHAQHKIALPMILLQGRMDGLVPLDMPDAIAKAFPRSRLQTYWIADGDHSLSRPQDLDDLYQAIKSVAVQIKTLSGG